ncbi:Hypothetical Protein FCC1311_048202 [Hondaea fermentalgiana]|uniref:Terminase large subunit n=1 Tax=Hondaea fermentalgiana TaxID=2315210 RepID=A0A2R5GE46_9STRA|nr:Hypothetical Protein FCC1311_048202 [Hondaea fermentalgiana]|eukprot:GBG28599.1 Hypothetical Protein FCC1311_048202 [Hondaea fermentalgiana]
MVRITREYTLGGPVLEGLEREAGAVRARAEAEKRKKFRSIAQRYAPAQREEVHLERQVHCDGDRVLQTILHYLDKVYRSPQQKEFHMMFTAAILRQIYKDDFAAHRHRVMAEYGFDSFKQLVLLCCPRRFGKTFSVSIWSLVIALCVPGTEISIFSPGKRQSVALMNHIFSYVKKYDEQDRILRRNEEKMVLRCLDGGESTINAYPSAVKTLKGVAGSILILEEMAVIDPEVVYQVVTPLLQLDKTCLVGISTITGEFNYMTRYLEAKDKNGEALFHSRHFYLACKACMAAGKAASCSHNAYLLPNWSSARKRKIINALMADQEMILNQEIGGIASNVNQRAFPRALVQRLFEAPRWDIDALAYYPHIFIAIDPNGAGRDSDFAITSMLRYDGKFIVLGMESFTSSSAAENHGLILAHLKALCGRDYFMNALKVFILESNLGLESEHIAHMLRDQGVNNYLVMSEKDKGDRVGFLTTNSMKMLAVEQLREKLVEGTVRIVPDEDLISVKHSAQSILKMLQAQLLDFQEVLKNSEFGKPRKFYSGKTAGKDDLIISLLLCTYWSGFLYTNPRYAHYLRF